MNTNLNRSLLTYSKITSVVDLHMIKGKRPNFDEYIGRATKGTEFVVDSIWANPFRINAPHCLEKYEAMIRIKIVNNPSKYNLEALYGKVLGCWCKNTIIFTPPFRCHGQVILKLINEWKKTHKIAIVEENLIHYCARQRGHPCKPEIEEADNYRYKRSCICCDYFTHTYEQYQNEKGTCKYLDTVSEWGVCHLWELRPRGKTDFVLTKSN